MRRGDDTCPKCRIRPRKPACGYCRECYNAYNRERYKRKMEAAGRSVNTLAERDAEHEDWMESYTGPPEPLVVESEETKTAEQLYLELLAEGAELDGSQMKNWTPRQWKAYEAYEKYTNARLEKMRDA